MYASFSHNVSCNGTSWLFAGEIKINKKTRAETIRMIIGKFEGALQLCPTNLVVFFMKTPFTLPVCTLMLILFASVLSAQSQNFEVKWSEERTSSKISASRSEER